MILKVYSQVQILFNGAQDLVQEFKHFLPDPAGGGRIGYSRANVVRLVTLTKCRLLLVEVSAQLQLHIARLMAWLGSAPEQHRLNQCRTQN